MTHSLTFSDLFHRFHVNLQCGVGTNPRPDIAMHFNPRFKAQAVVRNTLTNQKWGNEEKGAGYFPFAPNGFFEASHFLDKK